MTIKIERGGWQVTRFCCTSGDCITCRARANGNRRQRLVQCDKLSQASAEAVAANWKSYGAKAEPMPGPAFAGTLADKGTR